MSLVNLNNMRTTVTVKIESILSLIHCAEDFGYSQDGLLTELADMLGRKLSDAEIKAYAEEFKTNSAYGIIDYEEVIRILEEFREVYCD